MKLTVRINYKFMNVWIVLSNGRTVLFTVAELFVVILPFNLLLFPFAQVFLWLWRNYALALCHFVIVNTVMCIDCVIHIDLTLSADTVLNACCAVQCFRHAWWTSTSITVPFYIDSSVVLPVSILASLATYLMRLFHRLTYVVPDSQLLIFTFWTHVLFFLQSYWI